jgi:hypothetical protein
VRRDARGDVFAVLRCRQCGGECGVWDRETAHLVEESLQARERLRDPDGSDRAMTTLRRGGADEIRARRCAARGDASVRDRGLSLPAERARAWRSSSARETCGDRS